MPSRSPGSGAGDRVGEEGEDGEDGEDGGGASAGELGTTTRNAGRGRAGGAGAAVGPAHPTPTHASKIMKGARSMQGASATAVPPRGKDAERPEYPRSHALSNARARVAK